MLRGICNGRGVSELGGGDTSRCFFSSVLLVYRYGIIKSSFMVTDTFPARCAPHPRAFRTFLTGSENERVS